MSKRRESVLLAKVFDEKANYSGWYMSEKLDGIRCIWDGGISRGIPTSEVPYANTIRDDRYVKEPIATGLWTRYLKPIMAPDWFLDELPVIGLDGELWLGRGSVLAQSLKSIVKQLEPDVRWKEIKYMVYDSPDLNHAFRPGLIRLGAKDTITIPSHTFAWQDSLDRSSFEKVYAQLSTFKQTLNFIIHKQGLCYNATSCFTALADIEAKGGEGIMLRHPASVWEQRRSSNLIKIKTRKDGEGIITGFYAGKGKLAGLIGSVEVDGKWELSGFTESERVWTTPEMREWALENQGSRCPDYFNGVYFKVGDTIHYRYRERTADGMPIEAAYDRVRQMEE